MIHHNNLQSFDIPKSKSSIWTTNWIFWICSWSLGKYASK
jgi:hypothetical protein